MIHGAAKVARFFAGIARKAPPGLRRLPALVNRQPGLVVLDVENRPYLVMALDIADGVVRNVFIMRNPDKLSRLPAL